MFIDPKRRTLLNFNERIKRKRSRLFLLIMFFSFNMQYKRFELEFMDQSFKGIRMI